MKIPKEIARYLAIAVLLFTISCNGPAETSKNTVDVPPVYASPETAHVAQLPQEKPSSAIPNLQSALLDERNKTTSSPLGTFDFKNFTYPLPRGWQHADSVEITLINGRLQPKFEDVDEEMSPEEKAEKRAARRIGMSYVTTKFLDVTGDGSDEAAVILKIETGGAAIPQLVYIFEWKNGKPELLWNFRTGDRADGGLKDLRIENDEVVVEMFGQDRFLLGQAETGKITGDEEQLCCPIYFTRTTYKWNGKSFLMQKKRLTYSLENPSQPPVENMADIVNNPKKFGK